MFSGISKKQVRLSRQLNEDGINYRNIGVIYESLRDRNERPAMFGAPKEGEIIEGVNQMGG